MDKPITLCDRCDIYMSCLLDYDGPACRRNRTVEPTNADRIRSMTDEELAEFVIGVLCYTKLPYMEVREKALRGNELLGWLKEEAKE